jgi:hypothetical protein
MAGGAGYWRLRKLNKKQLVNLEEEEPAEHDNPEEQAA